MPLAVLARVVVILLLGAGSAFAQTYPSQPIRFLQGFAPGGNADAIVRILAEELAKSLGKPVVPEAKPGSGGNPATLETVKATPDGHTIVLLTTAHVISPGLYKSLPFDPINDLQFITTISDLPHFIVVREDSPFKTIKDLVDAARSRPGKFSYGTAGNGTGQHLGSELLNIAIGAKMVHVPYRGDSAAVTGLLSGDIEFITAPITAVLGNIRAGKFRALATTAPARWSGMADVPTIAETIVPGFSVISWTGIATTRGVPRPIVDRLNAEFRKIIALPNVDQRLRELGSTPVASSPEQMTERVKADIKRWSEVIEKAGMERQ